MSDLDADVLASLADRAVALPDAGDLTAANLPDELRSRLRDATLIGLGEASHGTQEFFDLRFALIRVLVEEYGVRAVGFEAPFHEFSRVDDLVAGGEGDLRSLVPEALSYRPFRTETMVDLLEWLQSYNAERRPGERVHVHGFDTSVVENAVVGVESYLDRVDADLDDSLREDFEVMRAGYDDGGEREAMLESARRVHSTLAPMLDEREAEWVAATSRVAYERVRHRLHLVDVQLEAHDRDREGRLALRDQAMATGAEWIRDRSPGPVVLWGANSHIGRGRYVLREEDVDVRATGEWLARSLGEGYCPIGFETGTGTVAAKDFDAGEIEGYPIPDPPSGSVPAVFGRVDEPAFVAPWADLPDDSPVRAWLRTAPEVHNIWGGHPDGDDPVRYRATDPDEFDWVVYVRETTPLVHLD